LFCCGGGGGGGGGVIRVGGEEGGELLPAPLLADEPHPDAVNNPRNTAGTIEVINKRMKSSSDRKERKQSPRPRGRGRRSARIVPHQYSCVKSTMLPS
jgi:hypothetical protein